MSQSKPKFKKILIKLSGEVFGNSSQSLQRDACIHVAHLLKEVCDLGVKISVVLGGGNIFRGAHAKEWGYSKVSADHMGMLATVINGIALQQYLAQVHIRSIVLSAFPCSTFVETYTWKKAHDALESGALVLFVGGTGNPYFTTDTAAALRASEMNVEALFKATKVDGIYSADPKKDTTAFKYPELTYSEALEKNLLFMDAAALVLCRDQSIPICVFDFFQVGSLMQAICHQRGGSWIIGG